MSDGFKLDAPHCDDCFCKDDPHAFILHDGHDFSRDRRGRKQGSRLWHRFRCNDPKCPAVMLVRWDVLARFVAGGDG